MWSACDPNSERNAGEKKVGLDDKNIPAHIRDISKQLQVPGSSPVSVQNHEAVIIEELKPREGQWQAEDHTVSVWDHFQAGKSVFQPKPQSWLCGGFIFLDNGVQLWFLSFLWKWDKEIKSQEAVRAGPRPQEAGNQNSTPM